MVAITIDNIVKKFGDQTALDDVSLAIQAGEIFFLLGASGCGKTTLLRTLAGFSQPDSGCIRFGSEDVTRLPPHKRRTAMMFQSYALWPHMTAAKNVAFGLEEQNIPSVETEARVLQALTAVHMEQYASRKIAELSGGQQQRIALARALVVRPRALLLDEPLSNLDAKLRLEMRAEIRRICREFGLTAIYVTHDQKEALSIADRVAIMDHGRIIQCGPPEEVYRRPRSRSVADFIGETNFISGRVIGQEGPHTIVETDFGHLKGIPSSKDFSLHDSEPVLLSIRPECWLLSSEKRTSNSIHGHIASCLYLGEIAQYEFISGSCQFKVFELNPRISTRSEGSEYWLSVEADDTVILRE